MKNAFLALVAIALLCAAAYSQTATKFTSPLIVPYTNGTYLFVMPNYVNQSFLLEGNVSLEPFDLYIPQLPYGANCIAMGPVQMSQKTYNDKKLIRQSDPIEASIQSLFNIHSNCTRFSAKLTPSQFPAQLEYFQPQVACTKAPRVHIYFTSASFDLEKFLAFGQKNRTYICDSFYCYYTSPLYPYGTFAITTSNTSTRILEADFASPQIIAAELIRLSSVGVIRGMEFDDALTVGHSFEGKYGAKFSTDAGPFMVTYSPSDTLDANWRQPARFVALWGLQPFDIAPQAKPTGAAIRTVVPSEANTMPAPLAAINEAGAEQAAKTATPDPAIQEKSGANEDAKRAKAPAAAPQAPLESAANKAAMGANSNGAAADGAKASGAPAGASLSLESLPWWVAPLIVAALGAFFMGVLVFYYRPAPSIGKPQSPPVFVSDARIDILADLEGAERIPTDIATRLGKSKSTVVEHLDSLVRDGFVERVETPGRKFVFYRITHTGKALLLTKRSQAAAQ